MQERPFETCRGVIGLGPESPAEARRGLVVSAQSLEDDSHVRVCIGGTALEDQGPEETVERFLRSPKRNQRDAAIVQHLGKIRPDGERAIEAQERLAVAGKPQQSSSVMDVPPRVPGGGGVPPPHRHPPLPPTPP